MGKIISLPQIAAQLSSACGCSDEAAQSFVNAFAETVAEGLTADGVVKVKGIGTFMAVDKPEGRSVGFEPAAPFANAVNEPFSLFEPVELSAGVNEESFFEESIEPEYNENDPEGEEGDSLLTDDTPEEPAISADSDISPAENEDAVKSADVPAAEHESVPAPAPEPSPAATHEPAPPVSEDKKAAPPVPPVPPAPSVPSPVPAPTPASAPAEIHVVEHRVNWPVMVLVALLSLIAGLAAGYFGFPWINLHEVKNVKIEADNVKVVSHDSVAAAIAEAPENPADTLVDEAPEPVAPAAPAATAPKVVTDTVAGTNYLSRIARRHYGKDIFWVYIYQENSKLIADPNNVAPGTVVVIPEASKYGIDPKDPESIHRAEVLSARIINGR